ncbi:MAG: WD40 repeat domain-containing protein, partial [Fuerstiella sp.]|nr:WD40 repeat domain-containing protein [Fuerstiella sp.]
VYRMNRITKRVIGDDANLVRLLPSMSGRIQSVAVSQDGRRIAAASSLNGRGAVHVYSYEFDPAVSEELKTILAKLPGQWTAQEKEKVDAYNQADVKTIAEVEVPTSGLYGVAFHPSGQQLAAAGADGTVRILETETGRLIKQFRPVATVKSATEAAVVDWRFAPQPPKNPTSDVTREISGIVVSPSTIHFQSPTDYVQLVIQAVTDG